MPNKNNNDGHSISEEELEKQIAAGNLAPIDAPPLNPGQQGATSVPPYPSGAVAFGGPPLPPNFNNSTPALVGSGYGPSTGPIGLMPIGPAGNPQVNSAIHSTVTPIINDVVNQAISEIVFPTTATGGVNTQTGNYSAQATDTEKLISFNITSASALTLPATSPGSSWFILVENNGSALLTINPNGLKLDYITNSIILGPNQGVTIFSDGTNYFTERGLGDGLAHASAPPQIDATAVIINEDFLFGSTTAGSIGTNGWGTTTTTGVGFQTGFPPHLGIISMQAGTTANSGTVLWPYCGNDLGYEGAMPLLDYPGWKASWVWRWVRKADSISTAEPSSFTECAFYAGLQMSDDFGNGSRPDIFVGAQFDTDAVNSSNGTRAIGDSTLKLVAYANPLTVSGRNNALAIPVLQSRAGVAGAGTTAVVNGFLGYHPTSSLVACVSWTGLETISSVKDSLNNTYELAQTVSNGTAINTAIYYAVNLQPCTTTPSITVTFSSSTTGCVSFYELGGTIILDQTSMGTGSSTSASTGVVTNTSTAELGICSVGSVIDSLPTAGTGWLMDKTADTTTFGHGEETIQTNQNTSVQGLATVGNGNWAIALATFKASVINLYDTGFVPTEGQWYRIDISCMTAGQVTLTLSSNGTSKSVTFSVPQYVAGSLYTNGGSGSAQAGNGQGQVVTPLDGPDSSYPWITGSQVTLSGLTSAYAILNGLQTIYASSATNTLSSIYFQSTQTLGASGAIGLTATGYPALFPAAQWGLDSTSGVSSNYYAAQMDFYGFAWNPALQSSPAALNPAYSRFIAGS